MAGLVTDRDTPKKVQVVVLRSGDEIATFAERQVDSDRAFDAIGIDEMSTYASSMLKVPGGLALAATRLPESYESVDEAAAPTTVRADDGLISSTQEKPALRLTETAARARGDATPGVFIDGRVLRLTPADLDRVWSLLSDPRRAGAARAAIGALLPDPADQRSAVLELPEVQIVSQSDAPGGRALLVLAATGQGATAGSGSSTRKVAAVDYEAAEEGARTVVSLGRVDGGGSWVGSGWVTPEGAKPYVVVAGGDGTEAIQVYLGRQSERLAAPGGVVVPEQVADEDELPPVVVAGFTKNGTVVPTMSNE